MNCKILIPKERFNLILKYIFSVKIIILCSIFTFISCSTKQKNERQSKESRIVPEPDLLDRLKYLKSEVDNLFIPENKRILTYLKIENSKNLIQIHKNDSILDDIETTFEILKDTIGNFIAIKEIPESKSGNSYLEYIHYFDKYNKTFCFAKKCNSFFNKCVESLVFEKETKFFNVDFN